jgi:hypothetical protein
MKRSLLVGFTLAVLFSLASTSLGAGVPCAGTSDVRLSPPEPTVGGTAQISITIRDCYGTPLPGMEVTIHSFRGQRDVISGSTGVTDVNGQYQTELTTRFPGDCSVFVDCESIFIISNTITWQPRWFFRDVILPGPTLR